MKYVNIVVVLNIIIKNNNMSNKILNITERVPRPVILPDGKYVGTWGGSLIVIRFEKVEYELKTEEGVRGINIGVVVSIVDGIGTFELLKN
jgi:hypothetical protein